MSTTTARVDGVEREEPMGRIAGHVAGRRRRSRARGWLAGLLALGLVAAACGNDDDSSDAATDTAEATTTTAAQEASPTGDGVILVVPHEVEDYDAWEAVFIEHRDVREQYGGSRDLVYRNLDDPDHTFVTYNTFPSADDVDAFLEDPSLAEAMERAGVLPPIPPPWDLAREVEVVDYQNPGSGTAGDEDDGVILFIRHDVDDYDTWKPVFDEVEEIRREHGATGHRLLAAVDDPNDVIVYETYPSEEAALAFFNDERLADAMTRAGVQEDTIVQTLRIRALYEEY